MHWVLILQVPMQKKKSKTFEKIQDSVSNLDCNYKIRGKSQRQFKEMVFL